jgi:hypothetical protein
MNAPALFGVIGATNTTVSTGTQNHYLTKRNSLTDRIFDFSDGKSGKRMVATFHARHETDLDSVFRVALEFNGDTQSNVLKVDLSLPCQKVTGPMSFFLSPSDCDGLVREAQLFQKELQSASVLSAAQDGGADIDTLLEIPEFGQPALNQPVTQTTSCPCVLL